MILVYPLDLIAPITDSEFEKIINAAAGTEVNLTRDLSEAMELSKEAEVIFGDIKPEFIELGNKLDWVQSVGAGVNKIVEYIGNKPIKLVSARGLVGSHLAEHAFALLLSITRGVAEAVRNPGWEHREEIRKKQWEFTDRTIGVIGMGSAGQAIAKRARSFEFYKIIGVDLLNNVSKQHIDLLINDNHLEDYLGELDVICLALPLTSKNKGWFNYERLSKLRPGAVLINVSRGGLVVQQDVLRLLDEGHLYGAGLDVLETEPIKGINPLFSNQKLVITPHIAGGSPLRAERVVEQFCNNLGRWKTNQQLLGIYDRKLGF
jgi:phosphoglycerate dehydrogenase-like enzyme